MITRLSNDLNLAAPEVERLKPRFVVWRSEVGIVQEASCCDTESERDEIASAFQKNGAGTVHVYCKKERQVN